MVRSAWNSRKIKMKALSDWAARPRREISSSVAFALPERVAENFSQNYSTSCTTRGLRIQFQQNEYIWRIICIIAEWVPHTFHCRPWGFLEMLRALGRELGESCLLRPCPCPQRATQFSADRERNGRLRKSDDLSVERSTQYALSLRLSAASLLRQSRN